MSLVLGQGLVALLKLLWLEAHAGVLAVLAGSVPCSALLAAGHSPGQGWGLQQPQAQEESLQSLLSAPELLTARGCQGYRGPQDRGRRGEAKGGNGLQSFSPSDVF